MKNTDSDRNIFLIKDQLEDYYDLLKFDDPDLNIHSAYFEKLAALTDELARSKIQKDKTIFIINRDLIDDVLLENLKNLFSEKFDFNRIYIISLSHDAISDFGKDNTLPEDIYVYFLPDPKTVDSRIYTDNFNLYIKTLFQLLLDKERVNDYIVDSFQMIVDSEIIKQQKLEIEELNKQLDKLSKIDYLTNIFNRRAFFEELDKERKRTMRSIWRISHSDEFKKKESSHNKKTDQKQIIKNKPFGKCLDHFGKYTCILLDIDFFKKINDTKGHLIGDKVLKRLGEFLLSNNIIRETDIVGRYGGEEFTILLPETSSYNANIVAARLRETIKEEAFLDSDGKPFHITVSMGISEFKISDNSNDEIIERADHALYYAKEHGRDQIIIFEEIDNSDEDSNDANEEH